jgi:hypothetical protein
LKLTLESARALRDGGIDALAALDDMVRETLHRLPEELHADIQSAIGHAMGVVVDETINRAIKAFPELKPDEETWINIAKTKALKRGSAS